MKAGTGNWLVGYIKSQKMLLDGLPLDRLETLACKLTDTVNKHGTIYVCGNGGSLCSSLHFAEDVVKCVGTALDKRVKCIALGSNPGQVTCLSNDLSYDEIFAYELDTFVNTNDMLIALSVSGTSKNVVKAIEVADSYGIYTVGISGYKIKTGGRGKTTKKHISDMVELPIVMDSRHFGQVEDTTMTIFHMMVNLLSEKQWKKKFSL